MKKIFATIALAVLLLTSPAVPVAKANGSAPLPQPGSGPGGCIWIPPLALPGFWFCWGGATPPTQ